MNHDEAYASVYSLLDRDIAYRTLYIEAMEHCTEELDEFEAAEWLDARRTQASQVQDGGSILATLIRRGGIDRTVLVDGKPYPGTLEELYADETVPDDATSICRVKASAAGLEAARMWRSILAPNTLFAEKPRFVPAFRAVLAACAEHPCTTAEVSEALEAAGLRYFDDESKQQVHASYFTSALESHGALVWDRKRWSTTPAGAALIASE
ncbi:MAG: hypothetical protein IJG53_01020 [Eggerthellaceae bacterium]|nr:hypothetical protein [Eggerthellaceae bacterium]